MGGRVELEAARLRTAEGEACVVHSHSHFPGSGFSTSPVTGFAMQARSCLRRRARTPAVFSSTPPTSSTRCGADGQLPPPRRPPCHSIHPLQQCSSESCCQNSVPMHATTCMGNRNDGAAAWYQVRLRPVRGDGHTTGGAVLRDLDRRLALAQTAAGRGARAGAARRANPEAKFPPLPFIA